MGPLFYYDLVRLARRGRSTLLRCGYGLVLLLALYGVYQQYFPQEPLLTRPFAPGPSLRVNQLAQFSVNFAVALIALQVAAILVLTPAHIAGAVSEERERRTLELLFTTHLSNREIILGKLFSRLSHLAGLMLTGLPVLSLLQLWGGVDGSVVLVGATVTALTLLSVGSVSILWSVLARDSLQAVVASYLTVLFVSLVALALGCGILSPIGFVLWLEEYLGVGFLHRAILGPGGFGLQSFTGTKTGLFGLTVGYAAIHGGIAFLCLTAAIVKLRDELPAAPPRRPTRRPTRLVRPNPSEPGEPSGPRYPVTDAALLWKEVYHRGNAMAGWSFGAVFGWTVGLSFVIYLLVAPEKTPPNMGPPSNMKAVESMAVFARDKVNPLLRGLSIALAGGWCLLVALQAAGSITKEREQRTLGSLLTLPSGRTAILGAKWLGGPLRYRSLGYCLAGLWTFGLITGALHPLGVALLVVATCIHVAFLASLGIWLSLSSRSTLWAYLAMALMLMLMFLGSWLVLIYTELLGGSPDNATWWDDALQIGLNAPRTWWFLGLNWDEFSSGGGKMVQTLRATLAGLAAYAALAGTLWLAACQRFRTEQPAGG